MASAASGLENILRESEYAHFRFLLSLQRVHCREKMSNQKRKDLTLKEDEDEEIGIEVVITPHVSHKHALKALVKVQK